mmetsp:Transcript_3668/g.11321  ORF Transcript_3668/g.11321 Transcript_3668/m.11321 type:complete len:149 (-) Transcript_3668:220-666(-)
MWAAFSPPLALCSLAAGAALGLRRPSSAPQAAEAEPYFEPLLAPPPVAPSGEVAGGTWTQTAEELQLVLPLPATTRAKNVSCKILPTSISLAVNHDVVLNGRLLRTVVPDECEWAIEGGGEARLLRLTLAKRTPTAGVQHWQSVLAPQ